MKKELKTLLFKKRYAIILVFVISLLLSTAGYIYYNYSANQIHAEEVNNLTAIAQLKINQIVQWHKERNADAEVISNGSFLLDAIQKRLQNKNDKTSNTYIHTKLSQNQKAYGYEAIILSSVNGEMLLSVGSNLAHFDKETSDRIIVAVKHRKIEHTDFYYCNTEQKIHYDIIAPLINDKNKVIAAIVLRVDPSKYLFPLIQSWPTPSKTAETLLIRKKGDKVLFLNNLKFRKDAALKLEIPLTEKDVPAVQAVLGYKGIWEGKDYRGVKVLSYINNIPGTNWYMISKIDNDEIFSELRFREGVIILFILLLILSITAGLSWIYHFRQRNIYMELYKTQEGFKATLYSIGDAVITTDSKGKIQHLNLVAERMTGWSEADAKGEKLENVFKIINEETRNKLENPIRKVLVEGVVIGIANHTLLVSKDGKEIPIADSGAPIKDETGEIVGVVLVFRDQTEERAAKKALTNSENRYRRLFEAARDGIIILDADTGRIVNVNPYLIELLGYSYDTFLEKRIWDIGFLKDIATNKEYFLELQQKEYIKYEDLPLETASGQKINVEFVSNVYLVDNKKVIQCNIRDITERRAIENKLRLNEAQFRNVFENSPVGKSLTGIDGSIRSNKAFNDMLGYSHYQFQTKNWKEITHPDDIQKSIEVTESLIKGEKSLCEFEKRYIHKDGSIILTEVRTTLQKDEQGKPLYFISTIIDITERKRAEKELNILSARQSAILDSVPDIIMEVDNNKIYTWANSAGIEFFGDDVIGKEAAVYFEGEQDTYVKVQPVFNGSGDIVYLESLQRRKDGKIRLLAWWCRVLKNQNGNVTGVLSVAQDITERKRAEEAIIENEKFLKETQKIAQLGSYTLDINTGIWKSSEILDSIFGIEPDFDKSVDGWTSIIHPEWQNLMVDYFANEVVGQRKSFDKQYKIIRSNDKSERWVHGLGELVFDKKDKPIQMIGTIRDITVLKNAEQEIINLNRIYAILSNTNQAAVRIKDRQKLFNEICRIAIEDGKFRMAWIGLVNYNSNKVDVAAAAGVIENYLEDINLDLGDEIRSQYLSGIAIINGTNIIANDIENDKNIYPWKENALRLGYKSSAAFPLKVFGKVIGTFSIYTSQKDYFHQQEIKLLDEMAMDISFAIEFFETEKIRIKTEENLYQSEERFRTLYENSTIGLYRTTPGGEILLANPTLVRLLGYSSFEELATRDLEKDGFELDYDRRLFIERINMEGEVKGFESAWTRKDGTIVYVLESAKAIHDSKGQIMYYDGSVEDITERRIAQDALKESELRFKQVSESASEWIWEVDSNGLYTYVSPAIEELLGYKVEEIIGIKYFYDFFDPKNKEEMKQAALAAFGRHERFKDFINVNIHKDGRKIILSTTAFPVLNKENKLIGYRGVDVDITERQLMENELRESEARLNEAMQIARLGTWEYDVDSEQFKFNDQFYKIMRTTAEREGGYFMPAMKYAQKFVHPDDIDVVGVETNKALETNDPNYYSHLDHRIIFADGGTGYFNVNIRIKKDSQGRTVKTYGVNQDITRRKLAEEKLQESEERLRVTMEVTKIGIWDWNVKKDIWHASPTFYTMLGYEPDPGLADREVWLKRVHPDDVLAIDEKIQSVLNGTDAEYQYEARMKHSDGSYRWHSVIGHTIEWDENSMPTRLIGVRIDITERKLAEEALRENEEIFNQFMTHSPVYIFYKDENMRPLRLSKNFEKLLNKPLEKILGKNMFELFPSDISKTMVENDKKILHSGELVKEDEKIDDRYYTTIKFPINIEGKPRYLAGFTIDITDRMLIEEVLHESNEFLERLFNSANAPIVVWNDQFIITRFNPAFERLTGRTAKKVIGQSLEILFPSENIESSMNLMRKVQAGEQLKNVEINFLHFDGSIRIVLWNSASVIGIDGKSIATIAQGLDITGRKEIEEALRKSKKEFQTYFDSNSVGLSVTSVDNTWIEVNQKLCEIFGYTKAELLQHTWLDLTHPEDLSANLKLYNKALNGEIDNYNLEKRFFRKEGNIIYVSISAVCQRNNDGSVHHFLTSYNDITERKLAEEAILNSEVKLRSLNARLENVREEERINLSRELHDHLGQNLTGLKMEISYFANKMRTNQAFDTLDFLSKAPGIIALIDEMINNVRKISAELRPNVLDYLGLIPAIEWQIDELKKRTQIDCVLKSEVAKIDLGVQVNSSIFRIVQEAFTNIIRHSGATEVIVSIKAETDLIKLEILDNGKGIKKEDISALHSLGIIGMKERTLQFNGKLYLDNGPQGGTLLTLIIPNAED